MFALDHKYLLSVFKILDPKYVCLSQISDPKIYMITPVIKVNKFPPFPGIHLWLACGSLRCIYNFPGQQLAE